MELIFVITAITFLLIFLWLRRAQPNLPPSPKKPLPIVGHLLYMSENPRPLFKKWRKQCGDIFSLKVFGTHVIVLNGLDVIKDALVKNADVFSDRPYFFIDEAAGFPGKGIVFSSGHNWKEQRSVGLAILRKFGMGKNILAEKIQEEVSAYVNYLASMKGKPTDIKTMTNISTSNVICSIIIGHRFEYNDVGFQELMGHLDITISNVQNVSLINFLPWLRHLPGDIFRAKKVIKSAQEILKVLQGFVNEKRRNVVDSDDADNFIEAYIAERNKKVQAGESTTMDDGNLVKNIINLFAAGTETTSTTVYWCVLYMLNFPDIQEKVYREIKEIVGTHRIPNMQDRSNLPYLNAVILETQRLASIVPFSLTHLCKEDVTFRGFFIPKGSSIIPNLDSVLHDKKIWGEDVMNFKPERFLDASGKLQDREELIPFSIGRRVCLGEALAKMELFLFLSNMFQRFQFLPKGKAPPNYTKYVSGITYSAKPYEVRLVERQ